MNEDTRTREELIAELARLRERLADAGERIDLLESSRPAEASRAAELEQDLRLASVLADAAVDGTDLRDVSRVLAREIQRVFDSHSVNLYVISPDGSELEMLNIGLTPGIMNAAERILKIKIPLIRVPRSNESTLWRVIEGRETKVWNTPEEVAAILQEFAEHAPESVARLRDGTSAIVRHTIKVMALGCAVHIPLYARGQAVGLLAVASREQIPEEDIARIEAISTHVAGILSSARIEQDWRAERDRADSYMEAAPGFMLVLDTEGRVQSISRVGCEILGLPEESILGLDWAESFIPERYREGGRQRIFEILREGLDDVFDGHALTARGETRLVRWRTTAMKDASGVVTGLFATGTDLTRVVESEERALRARRRYRALVEHSSDLTVVLDATGVFTYVSPSAAQILGFAPPELLGKPAGGFVHPDDSALFADAFADASSQPGVSRSNAMRVRTKDGSWVLLEGRANLQLSNPDVEGMVLNLRDVTERVRLERSMESSARRFRALIEHSHELMLVLGDDLMIRYASPSCSRELGYSMDALAGLNIEEIVHAEDLDRSLFRPTGSPGIPFGVKMRLRTEDRRWVPYDVTVAELLDDPAVRGFIVNAIRACEHAEI